ncbi:MAG: hypothetical protein ACOYNL_09930 [Rickettsiales bacterium]
MRRKLKFRCADQGLAVEDAADQLVEDEENDGEFDQGKSLY